MPVTSDNTVAKQSIKRLEIQINNFNIAIPHHVDLLKQHKRNIKKFKEQEDWEQLHKENLNVSRLIKQLKELLYQMDTLKAQVLDSDIHEFDRLTANARSSIVKTTEEYLELQLNLLKHNPHRIDENNENGRDGPDPRRVQIYKEQEDLDRQEACLHAWNSLQTDVQELHELFVSFNQIVHEQGETVNRIEETVEETHGNVIEGAKELVKASRYKVAAYPVTGALIGTCLGGPIGLLAGLKIGGLSAVGCGLLGFTGGSFLKKKQIEMDEPPKMENVTNGNQDDSRTTTSEENDKSIL